jgi:hypothetical protein
MGGETVLTDAPADDSQLFGFDAALLSDQVIGGDPLVASLKSPASGGGESWRDSGNLRGAVPVLDEVASSFSLA